MKYLIFLLSFNVQAEMCRIDWVAPIEREDNSELFIDDISHYRMWTDNEIEPAHDNLSNASTRLIWIQGTCPPCRDVVMTTVDTDGRESIKSAATCNNPTPPTVCS